MNLLVCLATFEQVITPTSPAGSFQLFLSAGEKRDNKKNAKMKFSNDFMPKIYLYISESITLTFFLIMY